MVTSPFLFLCWLIISDQIEICQGQSKTRVVKEEAPMPIQLSLLGGRRRKSVIFVSYMVRRIFSLKKHWQAHSHKGATFLGYEVKTYSGQRIVKVKRGS